MKTDDIFGKSGNGTIDAMIEKYPFRDLASGNNDDCTWLDVSLWTDEFDAIYIDALRSRSLPVTLSETEHYDHEPYEKNQNAFRKHFPDFGILGSFDDMYQDYIFGIEQIHAILDECKRIKPVIKSEVADRTLRKMIYLCTRAMDEGFYLTFRCD